MRIIDYLVYMESARTALVTSLLISVMTGAYGVLVVQRGLGFMGAGLSHAAFGGVGVAIFFGLEPFWPAAAYTILAALLISQVQRKTRLAADTVIGVFFALSLAIGLAMLSNTANYSSNATDYMFGAITGLRWPDVAATGGAAVVVMGVLAAWWSRWAFAGFDRELALADGLNVRRDDDLLYVMLALVIVASVKAVGAVLVAAFLVIPAATARLLVRRFSTMTLAAVGLSLLSVVLGFALAPEVGPRELPLSASVVLVQSVMFLGVVLWKRLAAG